MMGCDLDSARTSRIMMSAPVQSCRAEYILSFLKDRFPWRMFVMMVCTWKEIMLQRKYSVDVSKNGSFVSKLWNLLYISSSRSKSVFNK